MHDVVEKTPKLTREVTLPQSSWTIAELRVELRRFEEELRAAGLRKSSIETYVKGSETFLRWLVGEYDPRR